MEFHPFGNFAPQKSRYLLLGSFSGKLTEGYDWFYSNKRNQFWPILEEVYNKQLTSKKQKQELFVRLHMAIADVIFSCERSQGNNSDNNLINVTFNLEAITSICNRNKIHKIFFTSRFTEILFKRHFKNIIRDHPEIALIVLPSPSPRYAFINKTQKVERYKELLPKLN